MDSTELKSGLNDLQLRLTDIREGVFDVLSKENRFLSADQIREALKTRKVDLTAMRIATRIASSPFIDVNKESEPFTYKLREEYKDKPYTWHTSKYYRKIGMSKKEYSAQFE